MSPHSSPVRQVLSRPRLQEEKTGLERVSRRWAAEPRGQVGAEHPSSHFSTSFKMNSRSSFQVLCVFEQGCSI